MQEDNKFTKNNKENKDLKMVESGDGDQLNNSATFDQDYLDIKKGSKVRIGTLNIFAEPLKRRHEKHYKGSIFHIIADIILIVIILVLLTFLVVIKLWDPKPEMVLSSTHLSQAVTSGKIETFELNYAHSGSGLIENSTLNVSFPDNFILESVSPANLFNQHSNTFQIGDLTAGANGKIKITGRVFGELGSKQNMFFTFNYYKNNKEFSVLNSLHYNIENSVLELSLDIPEKIYQDVEFSGYLSLKNNSSKDMNGVEVVFDENIWRVQAAGCSLEHSVAENIITIDKLGPGKIADIYVSILASAEVGEYDFIVETFLKPQEEKIKQERKTYKIKVLIPNFQISISSDKRAIEAFDSSNFSFIYQNNEGEELKDIILSILPLNNSYSFKNINLINSVTGVNFNDNKIKIQSLAPGESGKFDLSLGFSRNRTLINQEYGFLLNIDYTFNDQNIKLTKNSPALRVSSDLKVSSRGFYYSPQGDQLGVGPIPPRVGIPTTYWVFWELNNFGNDLSDFVLSAEVPSNVAWTNNTNLLAGKLRYAEIGGRVIWEIENVSKTDGDYKAGFEIQFIPREEDVAKIITLLSNISYKAYDSFAQKEISGYLKDIDTNLIDDKLISGKGVVVN